MIKKTSLAVFLLLGIHSFAQFNKNRIMINGRCNFYSDKQERENSMNNNLSAFTADKISEGNLNLNIGYFLTDNFAIGGIFGTGLNKNIHSESFMGSHSSLTATNTSFYSGVFLRYNQMIKQSKFGLFFQLNNLYGTGKMDEDRIYNGIPDPGLYKSTNHMFKIGVTPGLMYFITNRLSIETSIGDLSYISSVSKNGPIGATEVQRASHFNADFSMATVYFGLTFYLGGKKSEDTKSTTGESK